MQLFPCASAFELERQFAARLRAAVRERTHAFAPVTIVAPTARLLARLRVLAARELGAAVNLQFLVHRSLAQQILQFSNIQLSLLPSPVLAELAVAAAQAGEGDLARTARGFDGIAPVIAATFRDLRDAGVLYNSKTPVPKSAAELWHAFGRYENAIARARKTGGAADGAELYQVAAAAAPAVAERFGRILHTGAFDLVGVVESLVLALDRVANLEILAPGITDGNQDEFGRSRANVILTKTSAELPAAPAPRAWASAGAPPVEWIECPSAEDELAAAARRVLRLHAEGIALEEIVIVARSLEEYAPLLEPVFRAHSCAFTSSARIPARSHPAARAVLDLYDCIVYDFPRATFIRFLRALPRERMEFAADTADLLARKYMIAGAADWTQTLPRLLQLELERAASAEDEFAQREVETLAASLAQARAIGALVHEIYNSAAPLREARTHAAAAQALDAIARRFLNLQIDGDAGAEAVLAKMYELAALDAVGIVYDGLEGFAARAKRAAHGAAIPVSRADRGGVRILDLQQLRGMTFRRVIWIGFHEGLMPRAVREDALFSDDDRAAIGKLLQKPVPVKRDGVAEERWLFALTLGAVDERLVVTRQRADASGRPRNESPFARELRARLAANVQIHDINNTDNSNINENRDNNENNKNPGIHTIQIPWHPAQRAAAIAEGGGILEPREALAAAALHAADGPAALLASVNAGELYYNNTLKENIRRGARWLAAVDSFAPSGAESLQFDGRVAPVALLKFGATSLERLGQCPLRFFFQDLLKIRPLEDPAEGDLPDRGETGRLVHNVLAELYEPALLDAAREGEHALDEWLRAHIDAAFYKYYNSIQSVRLRGREPLARAFATAWKGAILDFAREDAARLAAMGANRILREENFSVNLQFGGAAAQLRGRFDRVVVLGGDEGDRGAGVMVTDYKTKSGDLKELTSIRKFTRGDHLQLAIYAIVAARQFPDAGPAGVEAVAVRPDPGGAGANARAVIQNSKFNDHATEIHQTIGTLIRMARGGSFPITLDRNRCDFCDFAQACRKSHAPTRSRVESAREYRDYLQLGMTPDAGEAGGENES